MDVFIRCNECALLKDPDDGDYIVIRQHSPVITAGRVVKLFKHDLKVAWVCTKCVGISFTKVDIPSLEEEQ